MKYDEIIQTVKNERMEAAIATAAALYLEKGIENVKMTDIAETCQLGVASLYRYFGTKQRFTAKVGTYIWKQKLEELAPVYSSDSYLGKTGIQQVEALMGVFPLLLKEHPSFLRFLSEFDTFVVKEHISPQELSEYEQSILNVMPLMEGAVSKGIRDGTVKQGIDLPLFYFTVSHSLMNMSQKFARGTILDSDSALLNEKELRLAIEMYVSYIRA